MLSVINKMSIKLESRSVNEGFARQTVAAFVAQLDPTVEELNDIKTIVSEAVTNAIEQARQPMFTTGDEERSGMGFTIMESFTDKLRVRSTVGKGTLVTLVKVIHGRRTEEGQ